MAGDADFDRELLARVRSGDDSAFGELFSRHADAVRRFALRHVREHAEADDLTAEAFFRVLQAIRRGTGPTDHVRTYLLTVARRVAWEWSGRRRDVPVEDEELSRRVEPFPDVTASRPEHALISRAFTSLPERWRSVLWQVEVEGERPAAVAPSFGLSPNAMAALARRAREGLRAAYLQAHLAEDAGPRACSSVVAKLGTYTAGGVQGAEHRRIRKHLRTCSSCNSLHAELAEVCSTLRAHAAGIAVPVVATALVAPAALGKAAWLSGRVKLVFAATASAAAVGLFGVLAGTFTGGPGPGLIQPDPNAPRGGTVLALRSTEPTATGTATSETSPTPPPAQHVHLTGARPPVVAQPPRTVVPTPPAVPSSSASSSAPSFAGVPRTGDYRALRDPAEEPSATTTATTSPSHTALVSTTVAPTPTITPTTVTLRPTPPCMDPA
ncbi:sigma-70 family RNA polymerase sigma factor [Saccharothrix algeriensis]|uniref:RNA polymerase sigma factor (Sigma-70 family) n=1 Tax=Saccharothrix algeriensis TaxID=173560 RepID=A0A8T8I4K7_9PSEU|nr:sigma-70 family RNA polymerase sigma factor [Saccharothrix algeriensis]MBM7812112.1 RNA polymerase sigma factor (sigma-70 family) [Saccharothrix algeriensis]QTR05775.1 sigma-70 family RNA polymerase sigma factor [Saccharothrix algeriensis]